MVKVDKGEWDKSRGPELNHEFNLEWLRRCQRVLKPTAPFGSAAHITLSLASDLRCSNSVTKSSTILPGEKPNPPPNLSCRYFYPLHRNRPLGGEERKEQHRFKLSGNAQSHRQADENGVDHERNPAS